MMICAARDIVGLLTRADSGEILFCSVKGHCGGGEERVMNGVEESNLAHKYLVGLTFAMTANCCCEIDMNNHFQNH